MHGASLDPPRATAYARAASAREGTTLHDDSRHESRPPLWLVGVPLAAGVMRMLPLLAQRFVPPPAGTAYLPVTYLPKDFLQYAAMSRQVVADGAFFFANPFTTEPQADRFVLLFHWAVGGLARGLGASPFTVFEWSRVPLLLLFFATLWWFLGPVGLERRDRCMAIGLVFLAGGLADFIRPFAGALPPTWAHRLLQDTSPLHGWSGFAGFYNPLWIAALTLALVVLRPLLSEGERSAGRLACTAGALTLLFFVHPYTALGVGAVAATHAAWTFATGAAGTRRRALESIAALTAAGGLAGCVSLWQLQDAVYRQSTGGVIGDQNLSVLWYPLTLGVLGALAWQGARRWPPAHTAARDALLVWAGVVATLHWLPFLNGYKFAFLLPLPVCVLAAPAARRAFDARRPLLGVALAVALFGGSVLQSVEAVRTIGEVSATSRDLLDMADRLAEEPRGHALVPSGLGNVLPALTGHRVWMGHWFLTPDFFEREATFARLTTKPQLASQLRDLVATQDIRYVVVPRARSAVVADGLEGRVRERVRIGSLELFVLGVERDASRWDRHTERAALQGT